MTKQEIRVGSFVNVFWEMMGAEFRLEVEWIPSATGDSWILRREDGTEIRTCYFAKMEATERTEPF